MQRWHVACPGIPPRGSKGEVLMTFPIQRLFGAFTKGRAVGLEVRAGQSQPWRRSTWKDARVRGP